MAETRESIIEAARKVLVRPAFQGLSLDEVARAAGVTRVTIYNQFRSKVGLLEALFEDSGRRMEVLHAFAALAHPDPATALFSLIRENCRAWARDRTVLQRVIALAAIDPEASRVLAKYEARREHDLEILVARLQATRALAPRVLRAQATAALVTVTSFQLYDQLAATGLPFAKIVDSLSRMARGFLR